MSKSAVNVNTEQGQKVAMLYMAFMLAASDIAFSCTQVNLNYKDTRPTLFVNYMRIMNDKLAMERSNGIGKGSSI
jgi:hypothetical protein